MNNSTNKSSMWAIIRQYNLFDKLNGAASLMHTVVFHTGLEQLRFRQNGKRNWYYHETWSKRIADNRVLHEGSIYDGDGNHLISTMQDGSIRLKWDSDEELLERQEKIYRDSKL
jgi:acyl-CoA thioesterase